MTVISPPYHLPDLRPFRTIQHRTRLAGGAVVTENGRLESDDFLTGVSGWQIRGDGDVEFNDGTFRGSVSAASVTLDEIATPVYTWDFGTDTDSWVAGANTTITRDTAEGIDVGTPRSLRLERTGSTGPASASSPSFTVLEGVAYRLTGGIRTSAAGSTLLEPDAHLNLVWLDSDGATLSTVTALTLLRRPLANSSFPINTWLTTPQLVGDDPDLWTIPFDMILVAPTGAVAAKVSVDGEDMLTSEDLWLAEGQVDRIGAARLQTLEADTASIGDTFITPRGIEALIELGTIRIPEASNQAGWGLWSRDDDNYTVQARLTLYDPDANDGAAFTGPEIRIGSEADLLAGVLTDLVGAWTDWTPTLTNLDEGAGSVVARYLRLGKLCLLRVQITLGAGFSFTGGPTISLPFEAHATGLAIFAGRIQDTGTRNYVCIGLIDPARTGISLVHTESTNSGNVSPTAPHTFVANDTIEVTGIYEVA